MQVQAIYDHGRLVFPRAMRFVTDRFPVTIELPDSEIAPEANPEMTEQTLVLENHDGANLLTEIREILGPMSRPRPLGSVEQDKADYVQALAEKYQL